MKKLFLTSIIIALMPIFTFGYTIKVISSSSGTSSVCYGSTVILQLLSSDGSTTTGAPTVWYYSMPNDDNECSTYAYEGAKLTITNITGTKTVYAKYACGVSNTGVAQITISVCGYSNIPSISGSKNVCKGVTSSTYTRTGESGTTEWVITPSNAGTITNNNTSATINWNSSFVGVAQLKCRFTSSCCGLTAWSTSYDISRNNTYNTSVSNTICSGADYTFPDGSVYNKIEKDTTQISHLTSSSGCDSSITTNISLLPLPSINLIGNSSFCEGDGTKLVSNFTSGNQWKLNGVDISGATASTYYPTQSGFYSLQVNDDFSCNNSSGTISLTKLSAPNSEIIYASSLEFCEGDSVVLIASNADSYLWSNGKTTKNISVLKQGDYYCLLTGSNGCATKSDTISVNVHQLPPTPTLLQNGDILMSSSSTGNQWYLNGAKIEGANTQFYTVTKSGFYSVSVTNQYNCNATSNIVSVTMTSIEDISQNKISIHPNPVKDFVIINTEFYNQKNNCNLKVVNTLGQIVYENLINQSEMQIDVSTFGGKGTYFVTIYDNLGTLKECKKLLLQ